MTTSTPPPAPTKLPVEPMTPPCLTAYAVQVDIQDAPPMAVTVSPGLRFGDWDAPLCGCMSSGVNCCMVWCLPCISLAQISHRIGSSWSYNRMLLTLVGIWALENVLEGVFFSNHRWVYFFNDQDTTLWWSYDSADIDGGMAGVLALNLFTYFGSVTGLVLIFLTWHLRAKIRERFRIDGSCCGDCLSSFCCTCCAIAQMATHVQSYKHGHCSFGPVDTLPAFSSA